MESDVDDAYLVRRAQEGYLDAFDVLVERHAGLAYRVAFRVLGDHHAAQDVAQDALTSAWQSLSRFRGDSSFTTWLYRIVTRKALNRATRGKVDDSLDLLENVSDTANGPGQQAERNETVDAVTAAISALPVAQRTVIVLHHFEGLSYEQVATVTGSSVPAVRSHLFRARRGLAATLERWR
jgi:RNA polymerase sigma-70 factor (ECF subfamily)